MMARQMGAVFAAVLPSDGLRGAVRARAPGSPHSRRDGLRDLRLCLFLWLAEAASRLLKKSGDRCVAANRA
jgi:hypothetical protein